MRNPNGEEIRKLRLRLGWSRSDFSRQIGCTVEALLKWEASEGAPSSDELLQIERLEFYVESYCEQIQRDSLADTMFATQNLDQISAAKINKFNKHS
jgi:transcriptional regulator with XRE-family HTH domain